jgi:hypothetical protein
MEKFEERKGERRRRTENRGLRHEKGRKKGRNEEDKESGREGTPPQ